MSACCQPNTATGPAYLQPTSHNAIEQVDHNSSNWVPLYQATNKSAQTMQQVKIGKTKLI